MQWLLEADPGIREKARSRFPRTPLRGVLGVTPGTTLFRSLFGHFLTAFGQITLHLLCAVATGGRSWGAPRGALPGCTPGITGSTLHSGSWDTQMSPFSVTFWSLSGQLLSENSLITVCSGYWRQIWQGHPGCTPGCTPGTPLFGPFSDPFRTPFAGKLSNYCVQWLLEADPRVPLGSYGTRICLQ